MVLWLLPKGISCGSGSKPCAPRAGVRKEGNEMNKRDNDHIRHATSDGVFYKVAKDIALAEWQQDHAAQSRAVNYKDILVQLVMGLTGKTETDVRDRIETDVNKERAVIERMAETMLENMNP